MRSRGTGDRARGPIVPPQLPWNDAFLPPEGPGAWPFRLAPIIIDRERTDPSFPQFRLPLRIAGTVPMLRIHWTLPALLVLFAGLSDRSAAQVSTDGLIDRVLANQVGLDRAWFTHVRVDPARGAVAHAMVHVSSTEAFAVYEVHYELGVVAFTEKDLDRFGDPLGKDGAKKRADQKVDDLKQLGHEPQLKSFMVPEVTVYLMTNRGVIHAVDGETGRTRWSTPVGTPRHVSEAPAANDEYVAVVNGSNLYVLDHATGKVVWQRTMVGAPGAGPAVTDRLVFVPMLDGAIEAYQLEDYRQPPFVYKSHGRAVIQPVYTGANVAWPTDRGYLYVAEGNRNNIRYRLETTKTIVAPATPLPPTRLLVASTDGYVYCIHENSGSLQWRFSTGEPISEKPIAWKDSVLVMTDEANMFRLAALDGQELWHITGISRFVAASEKNLYCLNRMGRLTVIDGESGTKLATLPTETLNLWILNDKTDRVYIGTRHGVIQCLREIDRPWPYIHSGVLEEEEGPQRKKPPKKEKTEAEETTPQDENPFGSPPAASPFGGGQPAAPAGGGMSNPFGNTDPFGTAPAGGSEPDDGSPF